MELGTEIRNRIGHWDSLSRWERSEVGRDLRRLGMSYGEIMSLIDVKKSTLATWCRDVEITENQILGIKERTGSVAGIPRDTNRRRREEITLIRQIAREQMPELVLDSLWVAGLVMYWAEGAKTRNYVSMANADPRVLRLFITWVRTFLNPNAMFTLHLHLHEGNDETKAKEFWKSQTKLWDANFHKTFIKPAGTGHRKNHLEHGICTVKLRRAADPWNIVMEWINAAAYYFGVDWTAK